jgi:flagellar secretion chaperone FliS
MKIIRARSASKHPSVATASPAQLLAMLFERLVLDVERGLEAQRGGDFVETHKQLTHALEIVSELQLNMRAEDFKGGYDLAALYEFLHRRLVLASLGRDAGTTKECLALVTNLCASWRELALDASTVRSA